MSSAPERPASPRPPRAVPTPFYLNGRDSEDDFYGAHEAHSVDDINEISPADDVNAPLAGRNRLSASDSTHPSNVFADPASSHGHSPMDPYRFPMSFRDSYHSASPGYAPVNQQPNSPRVPRSAGGPPPSAFPDPRPDSPATLSRDGHTGESYFVRPEAPFMRSNGRLSDASRNSSYNFAAPPAWNTSASRVSFTNSAAGHPESTAGASRFRVRRKGSFTSTLLEKDAIVEKPWTTRPDRWGTFGQWITRLMFLVGILASAVLCYFGFAGINRIGNLCLEFEDNFNSLDTDTWFREAGVGGFGNGEFQWYTADDTNSFVDGGHLYIVPTLTSDVIGMDKVIDGGSITVDGCTAGDDPNNATMIQCSASSDKGANKVIPPVQSARLSTRKSHSIQYGKVEVTAKMAKGDWLWPAIWMLPVDPEEPWPISGEIDIAESRGNSIDYPAQGQNFISSALHWGPLKSIDAWTKTWGWIEKRRESFSDSFHTYTIEWTSEWMRFYIDRRTVSSLEVDFKKKSLFDRGNFPQVADEGGQATLIKDPFAGDSSRGKNAPFDKPFYLILDVAAGGTSGWFQDNVGDKPWIDQSATAMRDFAVNQDEWSKTWPQDVKQRAMAVDSVKMWKLC